MGRSGSVYRRCTGCRRRIAGTRCPCGHGRFTWTFTVDVAPAGATTRQQVKRGGFARKQDALDAMQAVLVDRRRGGHVPATKLSFGDYATTWLEERARTRVDLGQLAETTFAIYERDLRNHLVPTLGEIPLQQLDGGTLTRTTPSSSSASQPRASRTSTASRIASSTTPSWTGCCRTTQPTAPSSPRHPRPNNRPGHRRRSQRSSRTSARTTLTGTPCSPPSR
jgi:hypothetical protein